MSDPVWVLVVFVVTFLALAAGRVGRFPLPRGAVALVGGVLAAALAATSWRVIDLDVIALIAGLMVLAHVATALGAFTRLQAALRRAPLPALLLALFAMAATSAAVLNDAAVVVLVPLLLPVLSAQGVPAVPAAALLGAAANVGSLLTPFGNPQNAVLAQVAGLGVADLLVAQAPWFALGMAALTVQAWRATRGAPKRTAAAMDDPRPAGDRTGGRLDAGIAVAALAGFVVLAAIRPWTGLPLGVTAVVVAASLYGAARVRGRRVDRAVVRGLDVNVLALFVGLYLLTGSLHVDLGGRIETADWPAVTVAVVAASNTVGNVPAVLAMDAVAPAWTAAHALFLVAVSTLGGSLLLTGSAATLLAAEQARRVGVRLGFWAYARWAWPLAFVVVLAAWRLWTPAVYA